MVKYAVFLQVSLHPAPSSAAAVPRRAVSSEKSGEQQQQQWQAHHHLKQHATNKAGGVGWGGVGGYIQPNNDLAAADC
jgi:hypothetical protein